MAVAESAGGRRSGGSLRGRREVVLTMEEIRRLNDVSR